MIALPTMPESETPPERRAGSRIWTRAAATAWTLLILVLCTIPGRDLPDIQIVSADKIGHIGIFAVFGWLWMRTSPPSELDRHFKYVLLLGVAYAVLTEVYQGLLPFGRVPDVWDALANTAGLVIGAAFHRYIVRS